MCAALAQNGLYVDSFKMALKKLLSAQEGVVGAYKGLSLNLIKNPMGTAVSFAVNDLVKDTLRRM